MPQLTPRWNKIWVDLWSNRTRTALVVLSIAVGVFAVGMVMDAYIVLVRGTTENYTLTNPTSAFIITQSFSDELLDSIRRMPEVGIAEWRRVQRMRISFGGEWYTLQLSAQDYENQQINIIEPTAGKFPPDDRELLIGQTVLAMEEVSPGDFAVIETPDGHHYRMPVVGLLTDMNSDPSINSHAVNAYTTLDTFEWLGYPARYNRLLFRTAANPTDKAHVQAVTGLVKEKIENAGTPVLTTFMFTEPGSNPLKSVIQSIRIIMGTLAVVSLCLSVFLVFNTISALIQGQTRQIGVMKFIGGTRKDVARMYLALVAVFGLLAFLLAAPPALWAAQKFAHYIAGPALTDQKLPPFSMPYPVLAVEFVISLLAPLVVALPSVLAGTRISVSEAFSFYGGKNDRFGQNWLDRLVQKIPFLTGRWKLASVNALRQKKRVGLTLCTLVLGGAVFIGVFSVSESAGRTVAEMGEEFRFDLEVTFDRVYRISKIEQAALNVPGVARVEGWAATNGAIVRADGSEGNNLSIGAPPNHSKLTLPKIVAGRWLLPEDQNALVVGTDLMEDNPALRVGDSIQLKIEGRNYIWRIVGVYQVISTYPRFEAYANYDYVAHLTNQAGVTRRVQIITSEHSPVYQQQMAVQVNQAFRAENLRVSSLETSSARRGVQSNLFGIVVTVLLVTALLVVLVGGLGLAGTMSMNVIERTREIGVMRAIGATDQTVLGVVMAEGLVIGAASWLFSLALGLPVGRALSYAVGMQLVNAPLTYIYSIRGALIWLLVVELVSAAASFFPARRASQLTVRDVLAYE